MINSSASSSRRLFLKQAAGLRVFPIIPRYVLKRGFSVPSDQLVAGFIGLGNKRVDSVVIPPRPLA